MPPDDAVFRNYHRLHQLQKQTYTALRGLYRKYLFGPNTGEGYPSTILLREDTPTIPPTLFIILQYMNTNSPMHQPTWTEEREHTWRAAHPREALLADDIASVLSDPTGLRFYRWATLRFREAFLRQIAAYVQHGSSIIDGSNRIVFPL